MTPDLSPALRRLASFAGGALAVGVVGRRPRVGALCSGGPLPPRPRPAARLRLSSPALPPAPPAAPPSSTLRIAWPTLTLSPALTLISLTCAGHRRRHFDRRLVGLELEDRLILGDRVARLDQHAQHVAGRDVFAEFGECEVGHETPPAADARTQPSARDRCSGASRPSWLLWLRDWRDSPSPD